MRITEYIAAVLAFRNLPTTILVIIIYVATLTSVLVTDRLVDVPKDQHGLNLTEAYADLHQVAKIPHPYNSHANDDVRSYILSRVTEIARSFSHVHVASDTSSNFTISSRYGVYFEGTNILVKIDGTDEEFQTKGGLTLSAHYDSVSTAPGTTDDGMGVVTLIQMVKYLAERRPKRTVVFNINNGEEDWLNGAHAYLEHPWSKITDTFINLEGAASGGRPILFRATSNFPVKSFSKNVRHPHGNVLSADAFARGVIRSGTDYSVYVANGMRGLDFAFYKGRSMYHTKYDAIPYTVGLERALWAMMETTMGSAEWLANASRDEGRNPNAGVGLGEMDKTPVYFDLFGVSFLSFPLSGLFIANIVLLVVGPLLLLLVLALSVILQHRRRRQLEENFTGRVAIERAWVQFKSLSWAKGILIWSKFWLALIVTIGLQIVLVIGFTHLNPYAIYSNPMLAIVSSFTLAYLTLVSTFALPLPGPFMLPERQKQTTLIQSYALTWVFVLLSTIMIDKARVGGFYWVTAWNALLWLGCIFGYIEGMFGARGSEGDLRIEAIDAEIVEDRPPPPRGPTIEDEEEHEGEEHEDTTERTPLLGRRQMAEHIKKLRDDSEEDSGAIGWWILQVLSVVPIPLILIAHIAVILLGAMPQTLADGSSAAAIYACFSFLAILLIIPLSPFAIKMHRNLTYVILAVFLITTLWSWFLTAPFDADSPFKVFFQQTVDLDKNITQTHLKGISPYLQRDIVSGLPSAQRKDVDCHSVGKNDKKSGLYSCTWESGGLALPSSGVTSQGETQWMKVRTSRDPTTNDVQLVITGVNTRNCRIYFDDQGVSAWRVSGSGKDWTKVNGRNGLKEIRLWSRTWSRKFVVDLKRVKPEERLVGRVACEWAEYQSGTVGLEESKDLALAKIPAYEEVLQFLPKWAVASKTADGLVEVYKRFEI